MRSTAFVFVLVVAIFGTSLLIAGCGGTASNNAASNTASAPANANAGPQNLSVVEAPQRIKEMMAARGEQDQAQPVLKIVEPKAGATVNSSTVKVKLDISGDLKGYKPHMDHETKMGNHIHVILDNQPYEAYYNLDQEFELRNVMDGEHVLRVFASRPWHESYKNEGSFQMVKFTVKNGGGDAKQPTTTAEKEQVMANNNSQTAETKPSPEGKDMRPSSAGPVDAKKPLLTFSRPKGEYKGNDADPIMIDFWLTNAKLAGDGGEYKIRYTVNGGEPRFIDRWQPIWLGGWTAGRHTISLELLDKDGNPVDNGGYNSTVRDFTVVK
ncbi:MAG: hypothetical protein KF881_03810 [Acidobacteria bacterium]|nr:hypothetical protein [Acidobacteriota bacterium]